ncbi:MAG: BBP7 family outer membrane beta-barrel protein [Pirellulaceae bacterium]|nr:BBP7 family outer membrane beta-barrel protein [Pirellulaceae bacterium]
MTASLSTEDALAQYNTAPVSWTGDYVPVVVNDPRMTNQLSSAGDPYALVASRRNLPWLGNMFGSNANSAQIVGPAANSPNTSGGSPLLGGGAGFRGDGPSLWTQSPWIGNGNLFPNAYGAVNQRLWLRGEWLLWDTKAMETPPLVTASSAGTPRETAAVLGESDTAVLFGGRQINGDTVSGFRLGGGFWITPQQNFAVEAEYFQLAEQDDGIRGGSDGSAILGRPFFDIVAGQETAQLISYPGVVAGNGSVETATNLRSILFNGRAALCPSNGTCCNTCGIPDRVDWILGYRHMQLDDTITIRENLRSLLTSAPGTIALTDRFYTENEFHGMQLGVAHRANFQRAWLESMLRVALGVNQQTVRISGSNTITEAGLTDTLSGGLLAQRTNSGNHERDKFTMIPEVTTRLGIRLTQSLHATVGYSVIYFPNVVRAGDHIDTDVNPGLIPPEAVPLTGALRPRFRFVETDYWAHGLTLGGEWAF